ncbi:HPP family protein [Rheinheimera texasensis]|uniref:HPP family protein n=1 Tax=Rheinheimera texasensis TaxID=306205 RepID=UPI00068F3768|nr:HPP family protein [Rheinheimera texasensis]
MQPLSRLQQMLQRLGLITSNGHNTSVIHFTAKIRVALAAFIALFLIAWVSLQVAAQTGAVFLLASMGASAVILFALPASPLAKPWNFIAGHLIPACIGLACAHLFTDIALMAATTIALVLFSMYVFECMHPPGGATALVPVIAAQTGQVPELTFLLCPVLLNLSIMAIAAYLLRRTRWVPAGVHPVTTPAIPLVQVAPADITEALNSMDTVLDIDEEQLLELFEKSKHYAQVRMQGSAGSVRK